MLSAGNNEPSSLERLRLSMERVIAVGLAHPELAGVQSDAGIYYSICD